jgi:hypothetical protein
MTRHLRTLPLIVGLALIGLLAFAGTALAANTIDPADGSLDVAKSIYNALTGGHYAYAGALLVILLVALTKRYLGPKIVWLHSDAGGATLALLASGATALAASLAGGGPVTLGMVKTSALVGVGAAGGYATIKALVVEPLLKPLEAWAPPWMAPAFSLVSWIFDKPDYAKQAEAKAKAAGDAAVAAKPSTGEAGIVGVPTEVK